jgi:predicted type IV restriction endonuclease
LAQFEELGSPEQGENEKMPVNKEELEWQTRQRRIDPKLKAQGWEVVPFDPTKPLDALSPHAITEYPTVNGPADYALVLKGRIVGVVEAPSLLADRAPASESGWRVLASIPGWLSTSLRHRMAFLP